MVRNFFDVQRKKSADRDSKGYRRKQINHLQRVEKKHATSWECPQLQGSAPSFTEKKEKRQETYKAYRGHGSPDPKQAVLVLEPRADCWIL